jgi:NAD(P)-dependent dehydrogenase (short-subunit alcohol dehydrogenase family)
MDRLTDRVAIVTGAAGGIGREVAARFLSEGACVTLLDVRSASLDAPDRDDRALTIVADVTLAGDVDRAVEGTIARFGRIDILINSAGICPPSAFLDTDLETYDRVMAVNVRGSFAMAQACARHMRVRPSGCIVQLSSVFAFASGGVRGFCAYNMSKAAVRQMTHTIAAELAEYNIRVNAIAPGSIDTAMFRSCVPDGRSAAAQARRIPMQRLGAPRDVASACVFLCSDEASYVTGHTLVVDGGWLVR